MINGRKTFITGADGARVEIIMGKADEGACMFVVALPDPAIRIEHVPNTIDGIYDGPTEVHKSSLARKLRRERKAAPPS